MYYAALSQRQLIPGNRILGVKHQQPVECKVLKNHYCNRREALEGLSGRMTPAKTFRSKLL